MKIINRAIRIPAFMLLTVSSIYPAQSMDGIIGSDYEPKISGSEALDTTPPFFSPIPQDATVECDAVPPAELVFAYDIEEDGTIITIIPSFSEFRSDGTCPGVYGLTRTWTATDAAGNTASISQLIIVLDTTPPALNIPADVTLECGSDTSPASTGSASATDNCGVVTISFSDFISAGACPGEQIINRTWTATDDCGNSNSATQVIQIQDTTAPVIATQDLTVTGDENCNVILPDLSFTVSDNCGQPVNVFQNPPAGTLLSGSTSYNVTMTAVDVCGNSTTEIALVRVIDNISPVINCPANITVNSDPGNCSAVVNYSVAATDNCSSPIITVTSGLASGSQFPIGSTTVNLVATDDAGNAATCSFTVTVIDTEAPSLTCPANISLNTDPGECGTIVNYVMPVAIDNCSNATVTQIAGLPSGSFFPVGSTAQTFRATDASGNTSTCDFVVTVIGSGGPSIVCPADISVGVDVDQCGAVVIYQTPVASGCSNVTVSLTSGLPSGALFPLGTSLQTFTATDEAGNTATCSFAVTVFDNVSPTTICKDATVVLDAVGNGIITVADIDAGSADACGLANLTISKTNFTCADIGNNIVTLTATDSNGNTSSCTAIVTVIDNTPPVALCNDIVLQLDANGNAAITASDIDAGSMDACGAITLSVDKTSFTCADVGPNTVILTVTDASGNSASCSATVNIIDTTPPIAMCHDITLQLDASGNASINPADIDFGSTDACGPIFLTVDKANFGCNDIGLNAVTLTVTDANGNSSNCTAVIEILGTPLVAVCQDLTLQLDATGSATLSAADLDAGSNGGCGVITLTASQTNFGCTDVGENVVTLTVTDTEGNSASCTATVTIVDDVPPIVLCQNVDLVLNADGVAMLLPSDVDAGSSDVCGIKSYTLDRTLFTCEDVGEVTVTLTVTDTNGQTSSCQSNVTIHDNTPPFLLSQDQNVILDENGNATLKPEDFVLTVKDVCGFESLSISPDQVTCNNIGEVAVIITATDVNGNVTTAGAIAFVSDNLPPSITKLKEIIVGNDPGVCEAMVELNEPFVIDNCGVVSLSTDAPVVFPIGTTNVTWTATDESGNTNNAIQQVTVTNDLPIISAISGPDQPVNVGSSVQVNAQFTDNNLTEATIDWGDGFVSEGTIGNGVISGAHEYLSAGAYNIVLRVVDACREEDKETLENIMVIDPKSGFVSGAGYFNSPAGAFKPNPEKEGRFIFGFIAKYHPKYDVPQGHTVFYFKAGHLLFLSQEYDWLMVDGATAEFKGHGVVLKEGRYDFQVKMVDAHFDSRDKFVKDAISVKIWNEEGMLYNNDITPVARGYVKVHQNSIRKGFDAARMAETEADPDDEVTVPDLKELIAMYSEIEFGVYPNPFRESTRISYTPEITSWTSVKVYDLQGREESRIFDGETEGGETYSWDYVPKESTPNGVYLLRIDNGARSEVERLIYIER